MAGSKDTGATAAQRPRVEARVEVDAPGIEAGSDTCYGVAFSMPLAHGFCVGVHIPTLREAQVITQGPDAEPARSPLAVDWPIPGRGLTADERARAAELRGYRRPDYIAGRLALRAALAHLQVEADTIGATERGAPIVPAGWVGSISHKRPFAIALAARDEGWTLGVDIEKRAPTSTNIARRVLTESELAEISVLARSGGPAGPGGGEGPGLAYKLAVVRRFSIKEAVYKAIDPFVHRYVGFREVTVQPQARERGQSGDIVGDVTGDVTIRAHLDPPPPRPLEIRARVIEFRDYYISSARARMVS